MFSLLLSKLPVYQVEVVLSYWTALPNSEAAVQQIYLPADTQVVDKDTQSAGSVSSSLLDATDKGENSILLCSLHGVKPGTVSISCTVSIPYTASIPSTVSIPYIYRHCRLQLSETG